jgi:8-oxo-dGTP pyrophosphatase MutT (NUDIX family)
MMMASHERTVQEITVQEITTLISLHTPIDAREEFSMSEFLRIVPTLADPCNEDADPTHITASAIVVSELYGSDQVVLHKHKRLGLWLQPGGHIDAGELISDAALREAREETGLDVRHATDTPMFVHVDVHPGPRGHTHLDVRYLIVAPHEVPHPGEGESPEAAWFSYADAEAVADEALIGALRAVRHKLKP